MKKQIATVALAGVLALGVVGCGQQQQSTAESTAQSTAESTAQSTAQSTAEKTEDVKWTDAENADKAAEGAKLQKFGVPGDITVDGVKYENAKFAYSDGTAQATYTTNGSSLIVRKGNKDSKVAVTPIDTAKAEANWIKSYEDIDVTCYGPAKGAAYAIIFRDGDVQYGVTRQGSGDQKPTMDSDDVAAVVKAIKEANAIEAGENTKANEQTQSTAQSTAAQSTEQNPDQDAEQQSNGYTLSENDAKRIAYSALGYGLPNDMYAKLKTDSGAYYVVTLNFDWGTKIVSVDANTGEIYSITDDGGSSDDESGFYSNYISEDAAISAALSAAAYPEDEVASAYATLDDSTGTPYYNVIITMNDGEVLSLTVDAYSSAVTS